MNDVLRTPTKNLTPGIISTMKSLFGVNNFLVSGIFYHPELASNDATCASRAENPDAGINYYKLTQDLGNNGSAHTICSKDYSLPIDKINSFLQVQDTTHSSYTAPLVPGEKITEVWVLKNGGRTRLGPYKDGANDFKIRGTSVIFPAGEVGVNDIVEIKAEVVVSY